MTTTIISIDYQVLAAAMLPAAKEQLRIDFTDDDGQITRFLRQSIRLVENFTGLVIGTANASWQPEASGEACLATPLQPVSSFTASDDSGDVTASYELSSGIDLTAPVYFCSKSGDPIAAGLTVALVAGYATAATMDPALEAAVLRTTGKLYENRESTSAIALDMVPFWMNDILGGLWIPRA
jgi:uncharacterized phiE125 gp8 family phage protein